MTAPHQPAWVLRSASEDRQNPVLDASEDHPILADTALLQARHRNSHAPETLCQHTPHWKASVSRPRFAVLITGELRCLTRSEPLFQALKKRADLFVVTTANYRDKAVQLTPSEQVLIVEDDPVEAGRDRSTAVNAMKQWHKLELGWRLIRAKETSRGYLYHHVVKLRTDYHFVHPKVLLKSVLQACRQPGAGLVGASDKVFGGRRQTMQLLENLFTAIPGWFDHREQDYWPINLKQVLASDDALKWYGMNWPAALIGTPASPHLWRRQLEAAEAGLAQALNNRRDQGAERFHKLLKGHPRFASEICFSRFLNFCGIPFRDCIGLRGFLYSDRTLQP